MHYVVSTRIQPHIPSSPRNILHNEHKQHILIICEGRKNVICCCYFFVDSIDTPTTLRQMQELVKLANIYISSKKERKESPNHQLLEGIAKYLTQMLKVCLKT